MLFLSFSSLVLLQIRPSFCRCFSFLLILAMLFDLISSGRSFHWAQPTIEVSSPKHYGNRPNNILLQLGTVPPPMFPFDGFIGLRKHWQKLGFVDARKYDRNCFFSPVQCMLLFRDGSKLKDSHLFRHFSQPNPFSLVIFSHILKPEQSYKPRKKPRRN
ncbi:hypothetical protein niasHS_001263 [Heterodera schachtii]|uniref:Gland protein n=1 Tax=Heterodera schachtii TaxID=97005 RepID=A0ABD2KIK3_HETSC